MELFVFFIFSIRIEYSFYNIKLSSKIWSLFMRSMATSLVPRYLSNFSHDDMPLSIYDSGIP